MSVPGINANMVALLTGSAPLLRLQNDSSLQQTLQLGQVIEAKVIRSFQGGRYLVEFAGQERVIDSNLPLQQGQVLRARVLAMDEQVTLERMHAPSRAATPDQSGTSPAPAWLQQPGAEAALALFAQYGKLLSQTQWQALQAPARGSGAPAAVLSGLVLARLGLPLDDALLRNLAESLAGQSQLRAGQAVLAAASGSQAAASLAAALSTAAEGVSGKAKDETKDSAQLLAQLVADELAQSQALLMAGDEEGAHAGQDSSQHAKLAQAMATTVLNARQDGALVQRVLSLPLMVDGRLVELRLALFDESDQAQIQPELRQRSLRIALDLDSLGRVELLARLVNHHLSLEWRASSESLADLAGRHDAQLAGRLSELGIALDGARYVVADGGEGSAMQEVMTRVIAGGNFSLVA
jgi:hypothetical protein